MTQMNHLLNNLMEQGDPFKPASSEEAAARKAEREKNVNKERTLALVDKALGYQFDGSYGWEDMIDDIDDLNEDEKAWAKENISYRAYRSDIGDE